MIWRQNGDNATFAGQVVRIIAKHVAYGLHGLTHGNRRLESHAESGCSENLVANGSYAATRRIAHKPQAIKCKKRFSQRHDRACIRDEIPPQPKFFARQHYGRAVIAYRPANQHDVTVTYLVHRRFHTRQPNTNSRCRQVDATAFPTTHNLCVTSTDAHAGLNGSFCQAAYYPFEALDLESLFDERVQCQVHRICTRHGQVVGCAMNCQRADVTARKLEGLHSETVGCDHDFTIAKIDLHGIRLHIQFARRQGAGEYVFDQFTHEAATVSVSQ